MKQHLLRALSLWFCLVFAVTANAGPKLIELDIGGKIALGDLVVPEGASLAGGVLLITHGTLAHKDMELVEALQKLLAERGIATLAHSLTFDQDRRGGMYDCAKPHTHAHEDAVGEIAAWVDWLRTNGAGKISVLGHSRGGNQVAWFAAGKDGLDKIVLMAPATGRTQQRWAEIYKRRFESDLAPIVEKAARLVEEKKGSALLDLPGFISCPAGKASAKSIVSYYGNEPRRMTASLIPKIKSPVLIIAGSKDTVVPDVVEKFTPVTDGKKVRVQVIEDAGHLFLDFYAEDAADLIAAFLGE